jgi:Ca2+-binding EF-hand superfamily protein
LNLLLLKNISISIFTCLALCVGFGLSFNACAGDVAGKRAQDEEGTTEGMRQTLNLNFSPENREKLRKVLNDYSRAVDPSHSQIEERRRAMQASIEERFLEADNDGDGTIDRQEATEKLPQIARHFSQVDFNQDGLISLDELQQAQARILERRKMAEVNLDAQNTQDMEPPVVVKRKTKQVVNNPNKPAL